MCGENIKYSPTNNIVKPNSSFNLAQSFKRMKNQLQLPFWLITLTTIVSLVGYILIQDGMFMDAMLYTSVAKNLGNGIGTFWFPKFSEYGLAGLYTFHEHPPLTFGIQSLFYKVLGNSMYTERIYTFLACLFTAFLIHETWKLVTKNQLSSNISWLPIFFWIIIPVCFWSYQNNMQENTMGIFTLLAVYFSVKGMLTKEKIIFNTILSGIFIFCASLCKGVPGLFPLGVIGFYWLVFRDFSFGKAFIYTLLLIAVPVAIYSLLMLHPVANESLTTYVQLRLMKRVEAAHTVDSHFWVVGRLFSELLPVIIPVIIFLVIFRIKKISQTHFSNHNKLVILFCLIGASGSLALMLTKVQKGFYFVHSLPFWAIGLSLFIAPGIALLVYKINTKSAGFKAFKVVSALLLVTSLIVVSMQKGKTSRNADILHDVYLFGEIIPSHSTINMSEEMQDSWDLQCYLIRYFNISIDQSNNQREYYIIEKNLDFPRPNTYEKLPLETERYYLYKRID